MLTQVPNIDLKKCLPLIETPIIADIIQKISPSYNLLSQRFVHSQKSEDNILIDNKGIPWRLTKESLVNLKNQWTVNLPRKSTAFFVKGKSLICVITNLPDEPSNLVPAVINQSNKSDRSPPKTRTQVISCRHCKVILDHKSSIGLKMRDFNIYPVKMYSPHMSDHLETPSSHMDTSTDFTSVLHGKFILRSFPCQRKFFQRVSGSPPPVDENKQRPYISSCTFYKDSQRLVMVTFQRQISFFSSTFYIHSFEFANNLYTYIAKTSQNEMKPTSIFNFSPNQDHSGQVKQIFVVIYKNEMVYRRFIADSQDRIVQIGKKMDILNLNKVSSEDEILNVFKLKEGNRLMVDYKRGSVADIRDFEIWDLKEDDLLNRKGDGCMLI